MLDVPGEIEQTGSAHTRAMMLVLKHPISSETATQGKLIHVWVEGHHTPLEKLIHHPNVIRVNHEKNRFLRYLFPTHAFLKVTADALFKGFHAFSLVSCPDEWLIVFCVPAVTLSLGRLVPGPIAQIQIRLVDLVVASHRLLVRIK